MRRLLRSLNLVTFAAGVALSPFVITENFTGTDGTTLAGFGNCNWTVDQGTWQIQSNAASAEDGGAFESHARCTATGSIGDQYAQGVAKGNASTSWVRLHVRATNTSNFYAFWINVSDNNVRLGKVIAGTETFGWNTNTCGDMLVDDVFKVTVVGQLLSAWRNGSKMTGDCAEFTVTTTTLSTGYPGIAVYDSSLGSGNMGWDDFEADAIGGAASFVPGIINNPRGGKVIDFPFVRPRPEAEPSRVPRKKAA